MYTHQDWNTVILKPKRDGNGKDVKSLRQAQQSGDKIETTTKSVTPQGAFVSMAKLDDNQEAFVHKKIPKEIADAIKNARIAQKFTQIGLAQKVNEKAIVVHDVESMKGVYNHIIINKLLRALGLSLKNIKVNS
jgi:ribosome-binding protein aMBF1 (putative translation factor)